MKITKAFALTAPFKLIPVILVVSGCSGFGPGTLSDERMGYNEALQQTNDEELLINLVRLRYHDSPSFVSVSGITAQSNLTTSTSLSLTRTSSRTSGIRTLSIADVFAPTVSLSQAPVVSYSPLQGDGYVRELLSAISLELFVFMTQSGWSLEQVLRLSIEKINGISNAPTASGPTPKSAPKYEEFQKLVHNLKEMGDDVSVDYFIDKDKSQPGIRFAPGALETPAGKEVAKQLGLAPDTYTFFLVDNIAVGRKDVIDVHTRSLMGVFYFLSHSVAVPDEDLKAGLAVVTKTPDDKVFDWNNVTDGMFRVQVQSDQPSNGAVAVNYRGHWFYIADNDLNTKSSFIMLSQLLALQSGNQVLKAPVLSLPLN
jgi:hypothetical protein